MWSGHVNFVNSSYGNSYNIGIHLKRQIFNARLLPAMTYENMDTHQTSKEQASSRTNNYRKEYHITYRKRKTRIW